MTLWPPGVRLLAASRRDSPGSTALVHRQPFWPVLEALGHGERARVSASELRRANYNGWRRRYTWPRVVLPREVVPARCRTELAGWVDRFKVQRRTER